MKFYTPAQRLNKRSSWFGLTLFDFSSALGLVAVVSEILPAHYQFLAFLCVPVILLPMTQLRSKHREGYLMDFFIYNFSPRLVKHELIKPELIKNELVKNKHSVLRLASSTVKAVTVKTITAKNNKSNTSKPNE